MRRTPSFEIASPFENHIREAALPFLSPSLSLVKNRAVLPSWQLRAYANLRLGEEEDEDGGGGRGGEEGTVTGFSETWTTVAAAGWETVLGGNSTAFVHLFGPVCRPSLGPFLNSSLKFHPSEGVHTHVLSKLTFGPFSGTF